MTGPPTGHQQLRITESTTQWTPKHLDVVAAVFITTVLDSSDQPSAYVVGYFVPHSVYPPGYHGEPHLHT